MFRYKDTNSAALGTGISDLALLQSQTLAGYDLVLGPGRPVKRNLDVHAGAQSTAYPATLPVGLRGNGVYLHGQLVLSALSDFAKQQNGGE